MLHDRSYMRPQEPPSIERASAVTILLIVTIGAFILQRIINASFPGAVGRFGENSFLYEWVALNSENFKALKVWTLLSYAFMHDSGSLWHILGNMLGLFFIGRIVEPLLGKKGFLVLYFSSVVLGGLFYLFFHLTDNVSVIGASAAIAGILAFFCMCFPERKVTLLLFFIIPMTVKPKWIFWGFLGISTYLLLTSEIKGGNRVAHSAHLGGFLTGIVYYRYIFSRQIASGGFSKQPIIEVPKWFKRRKKTKSKFSYQVNRPTQNRDELQKEVNRILDKINTSGFSSLEDIEKETLDKAKELLNR